MGRETEIVAILTALSHNLPHEFGKRRLGMTLMQLNARIYQASAWHIQVMELIPHLQQQIYPQVALNIRLNERCEPG
jgi:hypothetical protein